MLKYISGKHSSVVGNPTEEYICPTTSLLWVISELLLCCLCAAFKELKDTPKASKHSTQ